MSFEIRQGDALALMREMPAGSVRCCVTSPPYWGLRDYGHAEQLGLEKTPEEYVSRMVEVFREVRRVLADDGTLWLNLGDSYAATTKGSGGQNSTTVGNGRGQSTNAGSFHAERSWSIPPGIKPKDLVGIPWRVAFALQQPWKRHVIAAPEWRGWMAGLVDGEGCYSIQAIPAHSENGNESHSVRLQIRMADTEAVERVVAITGMNSVTYDQLAPSMIRDGQRPAQQWKVSGDKMADLTADIFPFLTVKRRQAVVAWNLQRLRDGVVTKRGIPVPAENMEKRRFLADLGRRLNQREDGVDLPSWLREPTVESEPGWYLRSDVIWAKPNPMPESVTDRPTKAHEYLFLLAKSERYYYDADAVSERSVTGVEGPQSGYAPLGQAPHSRSREGSGNKHRVLAGPANGRPATHLGSGVPWDAAATRNRRSVWTVVAEPYADAHFAVMPQALVEPCVLAGSSVGDLVLDPFSGSGTVGVVALRHGRRFVGLELNAEYVGMARRRIAGPLFSGLTK